MILYPAKVLQFLLLSFVIGVFAGSFYIFPEMVVIVLVVIAIIGILAFSNRKFFNSKLTLVFICLFIFVAGSIRINSVLLSKHPLKTFAGNPAKIDIYGYVDSPISDNGKNKEFVFQAIILESGNRDFKIDEKVLVSVPSAKTLNFGQELHLNGALALPQNSQDFDYQSYLAKDGIFTTMNNPNIQEVKLNLSWFEEGKLGLMRKLDTFRLAFEKSIARSVGQPEGGFLNGILIGAKSDVSQTTKDDFSRVSMSHVLAISGYHMSLIVLLVSTFFLAFMNRLRALWFTVAAVAVYVVLIGAPASAVRAAIMGSTLLLAQRVGRIYSSANAIVIAGAVMIMINPMLLRFDAGFQLSFLAMLGIIFLTPYFQSRFESAPFLDKISNPLSLTLGAQLAVLPLVLFYFKTFSLVSLPTNLIVLPIIPFVMIGGFITGIAGIISIDLGNILGIVEKILTAIPLRIVHFFASPSWAVLNINISWWMVGLSYALLVWIIFGLNKNSKAVNLIKQQ